jgi:DNA repair exonuclease SbcCD ATPase subunit
LVERIPSWIERLLLPKLSEMSGEIKALNARINSLEKNIGGLRGEMLIKFESLEKTVNAKFEAVDRRFEAVNTRMDTLEKTVNTRIDSLEKTVNERFEAVNTKVDALEKTVNTRIDALEKRIPVIEEMATIKFRLEELERKLAKA